MSRNTLRDKIEEIYILTNPAQALTRWKELVEQHQQAGSLFQLAKAALTNKIGLWFFFEHTGVDHTLTEEQDQAFCDVLDEFAENPLTTVTDLMLCWEQFVQLQADPAASDSLSFFWPVLARKGLRNDSDVLFVLEHLSWYHSPDIKELAEHLREHALECIQDGESEKRRGFYLYDEQIEELIEILEAPNRQPFQRSFDNKTIDLLRTIQANRRTVH